MVRFYFKPRRRKLHINAKRYISKRQKHALTFKVVCVLLIAVIVFIILDIAIRPTVDENAEIVINRVVTDIINECVNAYLKNERPNYEDIVTIIKNQSGEISAISVNAININKIKSTVSSSISDALLYGNDEKIQVPVSNLFNSYLLNEVGPQVTVNLTGYSFIETDIASEFKSSGINQTLHRIFINISVRVNTNIGTLQQTETVEASVLLAETVLVGNVPGVYLN